jgi:6-phosphogluconolactonase (cycloisomerase 2 family)
MMGSTRSVLAVAAVLITACEPSSRLLVPELDANTTIAAGGPGAVYLASNEASGNSILVFARASDGTLTPGGTVPTGGLGTSNGLGNQLALAISPDQRRLFVVNAGSDDITAFDLTSGTLQRIGAPVPSGGDQPISLTIRDNLLYVLNAGSGGGIAGFRIRPAGSLEPIPGSSQPLSGQATDPAQIQFTPSGNVLVVTEKATNTITTYVVDGGGRASTPRTVASAGQTPFGFSFDARGDLVVSEAGGTGNGTSTVSSYRVGNDGVLTLVSGAIEITQAAACWIAISQNGGHAYTTNTGSGTVSQLAIGAGASLTLENAVAAVTGPDSRPQDADFTPGGRFLYVRNAGGSVSGFRVEIDGALAPIGEFGPIPTFASGIVAR